MKQLKKVLTAVLILYIAATGCVDLGSGINTNINTNNEDIYGSGRITTIDMNLYGFNKIELGHAFRARIKHGESFSVKISVDDNIDHLVEAYQSGDKIKISLEDGYDYHDVTLEADITMPDIELLNLSGATYALITGFDFDHKLTINASGASRIDGALEAGDVFIDLSGASSIDLNGSGDYLNIDCSGASSLKLGDFICANASLDLSGASSATLNVTETISADLSGVSTLYYWGNPTFTKLSISGNSNIVKLP